MSEVADWVPEVAAEAGSRLGLPDPLRFPRSLVDLFDKGVDVADLDARRLPDGPKPEFGALGPDMAAFYDDYEFAEYLPGAWPLALDGAGGFFCLDLREVIAGRSSAADDAPVVWSHGGNLGWAASEAVVVSPSLDALLACDR